MNKKITGYELIKKIQKEEIKSGTHIKYYNENFDYEGDLYFNGNWFSKEPYYPGVQNYNDVIIMLCNKNIMYEILEEDKPTIEKIDLFDDLQDILNSSDESIVLNAIHKCLTTEKYKLNEVIDYINRKEDK